MTAFLVTMWLLQGEIAGKPVAPSWGAWAGIIALLPLGFLVYDRIWGRGRHEQRVESALNQLSKDFEAFKKGEFAELNETVTVMDNHLDSLSTNVLALTHEWRGVDGNNGWKSTVRELKHQVALIKERNDKIDAVTAYEKEQMQKMGRVPERIRDKLQEDS